MNLFYVPDINSGRFGLPEGEAHHIIKVLRLRIGDFIQVTNGKGLMCNCRIVEISKGSVVVEIQSKEEEFNKSPGYIHVAMAPPKSIDRFEWFIEKATEIGVDEITPLLCEHSERKHLRTDRLGRILVSAMKQSLKAYLPVMNPLTNFTDFINKNHQGDKYIAHCTGIDKVLFSQVLKAENRILILIGPEGDFSTIEIEQAHSQHFVSISLGRSRLRTETAGIVACHTINLGLENKNVI